MRTITGYADSKYIKMIININNHITLTKSKKIKHQVVTVQKKKLKRGFQKKKEKLLQT